EEEFARENQRLSEQAARDSEIARIHVEEERKLMIEELISELVKYQDYLAEILKYQAQQSKPSSKKEQRKFYMSVLKSHVGWNTEHFRGMTLEQIKEKFIPMWKHMHDFVPMSSKEESVSEEELKGMMQLVPLEEVYIEALQQFDREDLHQLWILVKETFSIKQCTRDKEKEI
nr:hypothetical protein [Tanacetum cinerariifolium]